MSIEGGRKSCYGSFKDFKKLLIRLRISFVKDYRLFSEKEYVDFK